MEPETIHSRMLMAAGRLSYVEIAELTGIHPENVRRYMSGSQPGTDFIAAFCAGLGISADWLILGRPPMTSTHAIRAALRAVSEDDLLAAVADGLNTLDLPAGPAGAANPRAEGEPSDRPETRRAEAPFKPDGPGQN